MSVRNYYHYDSPKRDGDLIEPDPIMVSEREMTDDQALEFSLLVNPGHITGKWYDPEEVR